MKKNGIIEELNFKLIPYFKHNYPKVKIVLDHCFKNTKYNMNYL